MLALQADLLAERHDLADVRVVHGEALGLQALDESDAIAADVFELGRREEVIFHVALGLAKEIVDFAEHLLYVVSHGF